jgi:hypothetical protein
MSDEREAAFYQTFEFKGTPLQPMTQGRKTLLMSIFSDDKIPQVVKIHAAVYTMICADSVLKRAFRDIGKFVDGAMEWADKTITEDDYEAESQLIVQVMENIRKTRAQAIPDPQSDSLGDDLGN